jgi:tetratricopeptide (TPR) repeat protein
MIGLAILYRFQGRYREAEPLYRRALDMRRNIFGDLHKDVAQSYNSLGCLKMDLGENKEAEDMLRIAISQRESLLSPNHPDVAMSLVFVPFYPSTDPSTSITALIYVFFFLSEKEFGWSVCLDVPIC